MVTDPANGAASPEPRDAVAHGVGGELPADASDAQILARRAALATALARLDATLQARGVALPTASAGARARILSTSMRLPSGRWSILRDFVVALLAANPQGLLAGEIAEAARRARFRPRRNQIHAVLHGLVRRRAISRDGLAGSFIYRLRPLPGEGRAGVPDRKRDAHHS